MPLHGSYRQQWDLFALSGGNAVWLFGEWDGKGLFPLSAVQEGALVTV